MQAKELNIRFWEFKSEDELSETDKKLIVIAREVSGKAYAPYSGFFVGAAAQLDNDEIVTGNNQENAAFPSGLCAERVAVFHANSVFPDLGIKTLAITAHSQSGLIRLPVTPCGACRQVLLETEIRFGKPIRIILDGKEKILLFEGIENLLPFSFNPASLTRN